MDNCEFSKEIFLEFRRLEAEHNAVLRTIKELEGHLTYTQKKIHRLSVLFWVLSCVFLPLTLFLTNKAIRGV